jgi:hypothetical protein
MGKPITSLGQIIELGQRDDGLNCYIKLRGGLMSSKQIFGADQNVLCLQFG